MALDSARPTTFADSLLFHARTRPAREAIIASDRIVTFGMMGQGMANAEARLRALGLDRGDVVCVAIQDRIRHLLVVAALFRLGVASVSADQAEEIVPLRLPVRVYLQDAGANLIPGLRQVLVDADWFAGGAPITEGASGFASPDDLCRIEISSGSTGVPKAYSSTVGEVDVRLAAQAYTAGAGVGGRLLSLISLRSGVGFRTAVNSLHVGGTLVVAESAREALQMASAYSAESIFASTQQMRDLLTEQRRSAIGLPSLRVVQFTGGLATRAMLQEVRARICSNALVHYGATEVGPIGGAPVDRLLEIEGATCYCYPGAEVQIVDESDHIAPPEATGAVRVRTHAMARPYPPESESGSWLTRGGWHYTGDRGRLRSDGLLILEGRSSDVINSGGVKIAPELIEEVAQRHANIVEAAAFGAPGADGIEEIHVAIVARAPVSSEQLVSWFAGKGIEVARIHQVAAIPRTAMGKVRRKELMDEVLG